MIESTYAVNLADATSPRNQPFLAYLLGPVTPSRITVEVDKRRWDGLAIQLECEEERARAIIAVIRQREPKPFRLRCYQVSGRKVSRL